MKLLAVFVMLACNICKSTTGVFISNISTPFAIIQNI